MPSPPLSWAKPAHSGSEAVLAFDQHLHLFGVDGLTLQQRRGNAVHRSAFDSTIAWADW